MLLEGAADLEHATDRVEIEIYEGGNGVIRTYNGWFAVSGFSLRGSTMRFQIDTTKEIVPNALDREIVDERTKARDYNHRRMDYNNDPTTTLADVHSLFAEALARIKP